MKNKSNKRSNILLFLASLLVAFIIAEVFLWKFYTHLGTFPKSGEKYCIAYSEYLPFTTPAGIDFHHKSEANEFEVDYRFDANGFRKTNIQRQTNSDNKILLMGDSYTLGWGSHEDSCFAARIARYENEKGYQVLNAGYTASCSPDAYFAYLERNINTIRPKVVIVFLYTGNDRRDMQTTYWERTNAQGFPVRIRSLRFYSDYMGKIIRLENNEVPMLYKIPVLNRSRILVGLSNLFLKKEQTKTEALYKLYKSLNGIQQICKSYHTNLFMFLIPPKSLYNGKQDKEEKELILFSSALRVLEIPNYSLQNDLDTTCYFSIDKHFNDKGNRLSYSKMISVLDTVLR